MDLQYLHKQERDLKQYVSLLIFVTCFLTSVDEGRSFLSQIPNFFYLIHFILFDLISFYFILFNLFHFI